MLDKLKQIINKRPVAIMLHGKSISELEKRVNEYKDLDVCWASMNLFPVMEEFILKKINKKLDIVLDCSTVSDSLLSNYENNCRQPRLEKFLSKEYNNLWVTTMGIIELYSITMNKGNFIDTYKHKTLIVDTIFPPSQTAKYMSVPNSLTLLIAAIMAGGATKIVLFGCDGYKGEVSIGIDSYFKPNLQRIERYNALGNSIDAGVNRDTEGFENKFISIYKQYKTIFNTNVEIMNCSNTSIYKCLPKINYDEVIAWLTNIPNTQTLQ